MDKGELQLIESLPGWYWEVDRTLRFSYCDPAVSSLLGYTPQELLGRPAFELFESSSHQTAPGFTPELLQTQQSFTLIPKRVRHRDGRLLPFVSNGAPLVSPTGEWVGFSGVDRQESARQIVQNRPETQQQLFEAVLTSVPCCIYVFDLVSRDNVYVNSQLSNLLGYEVHDVRFQKPGAVFGLIHPEDRPRCLAHFERWRSTSDHQILEIEYRIQHRDGHYLHLLSQETPFRRDETGHVKLIVGSVVDLTESKLAQEAVRLSEERYRMVTEMVTSFAYSKLKHVDTGDFCLEWVLGRVEEITGLKPSDLKETNWQSRVYPPDQALLAEQHRQLKMGECQAVEYRLCHARTGEHRWVRQQLQLLPGGTPPWQRIMGVVVDIHTERMQVEKQRALEEQMRQTQKLESIGVLAAGVAHDFNNLLMGVLGNAGILRTTTLGTELATQCLTSIEQAARRAADLCRQLLTFAGKSPSTVITIQLNSLIGELVDLLKTAVSRKANLIVNLQHDLPCIEGDTVQLGQVIMNLITNASDALLDQPGEIQVRTGRYQSDEPPIGRLFPVGANTQGEFVYLRVSDTGCGISAENLDRIFDPFFTTKFAGRGLGLASTLGCIRGHQGFVTVDSQPGIGTSFTIFLPIGPHAATPPTAKPASSGSLQGGGSVLVIDDDEHARVVLGLSLRHLGFTPLLADSAAAAQAYLRPDLPIPEAIVLDLTLPDSSAEFILQRVRACWPEVPVLLISGYSDADLQQAAQNWHNVAFLQKPFGPGDLGQMLQELIRSSHLSDFSGSNRTVYTT